MLYMQSLYHRSLRYQQAFTLLELLVVLIIIGLTSSVVVMNTKPTVVSQTPALIDFLERERMSTLLNSQTTQIQLQDNRLYATASKNTFALPEKKQDVSQRYLTDMTLLTFYSDGTQTASEFSLQTETHSYDIKTDPFSNKIQYTEQAKL